METIKQNSNSPAKYIVLILLFVLPIVAYLFFSSGVDNFLKLPKLTEDVKVNAVFKDLNGETIQFENKITLLGFFGNEPETKQGNAINLTEKIYDRYSEFKDFQLLILITEQGVDGARVLLDKLDNYSDVDKWRFGVGSAVDIQKVFESLESDFNLDDNLATPYVFILDKQGTLRGRTDDEDAPNGRLYGYDSSNIAEVADKLNDDVKVILAEYRLALKKNSADRN